MNWSESILFTAPLRDVRHLNGAPAQDWSELLHEREAAAEARGRREGERALGEQLAQQRAELAELQRGVLDSLRRAVPQVLQETETTVIQLAFEAAQKIVAGMPVSVELVEAVVREALLQVEGNVEILIALHPDDLALLRKHNSQVLEGSPDTGPLRWTHSSGVTRGGCLVQTRLGLIDARREVKIEQLRQTLAA